MNTIERLKYVLALALCITIVWPETASAQVPPRFYWKSLVGR